MPHASCATCSTHTTQHKQHTHVINRITNQYKCHSSAPWHLRFVASWAHITHTHSSTPLYWLPAYSAVCWPLSINWRVNWLKLPQSKRQQNNKKKENAMRIFPMCFPGCFSCLVLSCLAFIKRHSLIVTLLAVFLSVAGSFFASGQWAVGVASAN